MVLRFGKALAIALPSPPVVFASGVLIRVVFGLWYMQVRSLRQMPSYGDRTPAGLGDPLTILLHSRFDLARGAVTLTGALNQYLSGASSVGTRALLLGISWVVLAGIVLLALASFASPGAMSGEPRMVAQLIFLPLFLITNASMGFSLTRRARMVWLRPGQDRAAPFARAERSGLVFSLLSKGIGAAACRAGRSAARRYSCSPGRRSPLPCASFIATGALPACSSRADRHSRAAICPRNHARRRAPILNSTPHGKGVHR